MSTQPTPTSLVGGSLVAGQQASGVVDEDRVEVGVGDAALTELGREVGDDVRVRALPHLPRDLLATRRRRFTVLGWHVERRSWRGERADVVLREAHLRREALAHERGDVIGA